MLSFAPETIRPSPRFSAVVVPLRSIVGAGLIGTAAARHAACTDGVRVALIGPTEQPRETWQNRSVFGAHHDEGRITRCTDPDPTWALLAQRAVARYASIAQSSGIDFFDEVGHLAVGPVGAPNINARQATAAEAGVPCERLEVALAPVAWVERDRSAPASSRHSSSAVAASMGVASRSSAPP